MTDRRRLPRTGFTLIELLVVIAIIAILLALMTAGIAKVLTRSQQAQTQQDIIELSQALENFKTKFGMYPPSSLNSGNVRTVMTKLWPALNPPVGDQNAAQTRDMRINAALAPLGFTADNVDLQGDQCMVLFLGGRHSVIGDTSNPNLLPGIVQQAPIGFSESPMYPFAGPTDDPTVGGGPGKRIEPFFKFNAARLCRLHPTLQNGNDRIASYGDGWYRGTYQGADQYACYAYFSTSFVTTPGSAGVGYYSDTDCNRMTDGAGNYPRPFVNLNSTTVITIRFEYANPKSFQIVSPGPDTLFGNAYKFPASNSKSDFGTSPTSADNFSNFYPGRLGES